MCLCVSLCHCCLGDTLVMALQSQGNVMCLLRPRGEVRKGELKHEYGILVHNMEAESFSGTCFMRDGRFVTLTWQEINKAFKKVKDTYVISRDNEKLLRDSYDTVMADVISLENNIEASQFAFHQQIEAAREAREARRLGKHISTVEGVVTTGEEQTSLNTVGVVVTTGEKATSIVEGKGLVNQMA